jgi:hypothetical protein
MVNPTLTLAKLAAVNDTQPELAGRLKTLLDEIAAGKDIRPEVSAELAAVITPEVAKRAQGRLSKLWPGGTLTLVKRDKGPEGGPQWISTYRLKKGEDALLVVFGVGADGKIPTLGLRPDREYE